MIYGCLKLQQDGISRCPGRVFRTLCNTALSRKFQVVTLAYTYFMKFVVSFVIGLV